MKVRKKMNDSFKSAYDCLMVLEKLNEFDDALARFGMSDNSVISEAISELGDIILDLLGIPADTTVEEKDGFCRDWYYEKLWEFSMHEDWLEDNDDPIIFLENLKFEYEESIKE
jgi:hypothetical protein